MLPHLNSSPTTSALRNEQKASSAFTAAFTLRIAIYINDDAMLEKIVAVFLEVVVGELKKMQIFLNDLNLKGKIGLRGVL